MNAAVYSWIFYLRELVGCFVKVSVNTCDLIQFEIMCSESLLGLLYVHLAGNVGKTGEEFRALTRGYTHWASGRLEQMEVNIQHPEFCHIRCYMRASMKADIVVSVLQGKWYKY